MNMLEHGSAISSELADESVIAGQLLADVQQVTSDVSADQHVVYARVYRQLLDRGLDVGLLLSKMDISTTKFHKFTDNVNLGYCELSDTEKAALKKCEEVLKGIGPCTEGKRRHLQERQKLAAVVCLRLYRRKIGRMGAMKDVMALCDVGQPLISGWDKDNRGKSIQELMPSLFPAVTENDTANGDSLPNDHDIPNDADEPLTAQQNGSADEKFIMQPTHNGTPNESVGQTLDDERNHLRQLIERLQGATEMIEQHALVESQKVGQLQQRVDALEQLASENAIVMQQMHETIAKLQRALGNQGNGNTSQSEPDPVHDSTVSGLEPQMIIKKGEKVIVINIQ